MHCHLFVCLFVFVFENITEAFLTLKTSCFQNVAHGLRLTIVMVSPVVSSEVWRCTAEITSFFTETFETFLFNFKICSF